MFRREAGDSARSRGLGGVTGVGDQAVPLVSLSPAAANAMVFFVMKSARRSVCSKHSGGGRFGSLPLSRCTLEILFKGVLTATGDHISKY